MRCFFFKCAVISLLGIQFSCGEKLKSEPTTHSQYNEKPNIVLILADDQGWGDLGITGNTNLSTPNIDALAKKGVSFDHFYVSPVCSPTRAELLTGRYFPRVGVYSTSSGGERLNLDETTIAQVFKEVGYATAAYGKWHNGMQAPYHPNARGFDDFYGFASGHWGNYFSPMLEHNGAIVKGDGFIIDDLTNKGLEFMARNSNTPFFLYLPYNTPHSPMQVPNKYWNRFKDKELLLKYHGEEVENDNFSRAALAMVENIDYNVGRVMQRLTDLELEDNTIVLYLSDNGPNGWRWNGGMRGKKGSTDEGGVRSPLIIQWKNKLPEGKRIAEIASTIDLLPTLTDLAKIPLNTLKPLDGKSLKPLLFEEDINWQPRVVYNHWRSSTSIRTQEYRLDSEDRLYDMTKDIGQTKDLSSQFPQLADSLKQLKRDWLQEVMPKSKGAEDRPFTLGHPDYVYTQIPARDGVAHGNIVRSNKHPNCTFFTNWISTSDYISWDVEVLADGEFEVELYYTAKEQNLGAEIELRFGESTLVGVLDKAHDPPLVGAERDRDPRIESYTKDFIPMHLGRISLKKAKGDLTLRALNIPGDEVMDFRLLLFKRVN
ncbi:N-acetylgalactosamine 6-sulfate sulfatase [Arenibacter aquaticus]|uniref:N-acetylgalactosamine 6-sulfate sulfatase n=1 Tax=Arenibacter aquaticus TaxID=2489054 RepID=A0A430K3A1_9FLAO|nr:arylsulfatase [Arenibacter aquaticus]RTE53612.1 N-acetylgalactosamine 6-sulfate sulfatase [Arenibacter aquaticus]